MAISAAVTLTILIIGIHRGDRRHLTSAPHSNPDAFARRLLLCLGVRYPASVSESANAETGDDE
jgi:hypothetical protein